jgi:hypothetical protein
MDMAYYTIESRTYTLYINSAGKISGTNNNATFYVEWETFLPVNYNEYKIVWCLQTTGGYYKDTGSTTIYSTAKVACDFGTRQFSYDTAKRGPTNTIGYITRGQQTSTTSSNILTSFYSINNPNYAGSIPLAYFNAAETADTNNSINAFGTNGGTITSYKSAFAIAQDFESISNRSDVILSGCNTLNMQIFFEYQSVNVAQTASAYTLDFFACYDHILSLDEHGLLSVKV